MITFSGINTDKQRRDDNKEGIITNYSSPITQHSALSPKS